MKTNKMIAAGLAASAIIVLSMSSVSASYGQGGGQGGQGKGGMSQYITAEQRAELENMSEEDRREYVQKIREENGMESMGEKGGKHGEGKEDHNAADMIANIDMQDVSVIEIDLLEKQYEEEMMANELYMSFYEMYGVETFKNIAESEAKHMEAVKALLDRYNIDIPTSYDHIQTLYEDLKTKGALSLNDALEVGVSIEIVDIDDIYTAILASDNDDIRTVLVNIGGASYNHMRGFVKALDNNNLTTDIDYSDYLSATDIDTKGPIKIKLAEKLEANGIELPKDVTVEAISTKMTEKRLGHDDSMEKGHGKKGGERGSKMKDSNGKSEYSSRNNDNTKANKYTDNSVLKAKYKSTYEVKYGEVISKMDNSDLDIFISKIDDILEKVEIGNYSDSIKEKYNAMLFALKDIALENIDEDDLLDGLFE